MPRALGQTHGSVPTAGGFVGARLGDICSDKPTLRPPVNCHSERSEESKTLWDKGSTVSQSISS